jgi:uncharacterized phage-associated protein
MSFNVLDAANFIVRLDRETHGAPHLTHMDLHKHLYFAQGAQLARA